MDRRAFLRGAAVAPLAVVTVRPASSAPLGYERVSTETGDPGEVAYATACALKKRITIHLDGVEQTAAITADANEGWIKRHRQTPCGQLLINHATGQILDEVVHGVVAITVT